MAGIIPEGDSGGVAREGEEGKVKRENIITRFQWLVEIKTAYNAVYKVLYGDFAV